MKKCYGCEKELPEVSEDIFFSEESKSGIFNEQNPLGVRFVEDAFSAEIYGDQTENWECAHCWWEGWWDI
jgi:hypothetical protein